MKESAEQLPVKISINMKTPIGSAQHTLYRQKDVRIGNRAEFLMNYVKLRMILFTTSQITVQGFADDEPGADLGTGLACASSTSFRRWLAQVIADLLKGSRSTR